jgi:septum site-determining protein MinD
MTESSEPREFRNESVRGARMIAVVSGKGGSGKTMLISTLARILDSSGVPTLLVDADTGTAGLSYYLGVNYAYGTGFGISDMLLNGANDPGARHFESEVRSLKGFDTTRFVGIGDHKKLLRRGDEVFRARIGDYLDELRIQTTGVILVDCRGGVDEDSIAVCRAVDDVLLVAETDPASFQATQYLAEIFSERDLGHKLKAFVVNRVFDDPAFLMRQGATSFRSQPLGAIPFDLTALQDFNVGKIPGRSSLYYRHVYGVAARFFHELNIPPPSGLLKGSEFTSASYFDPDSVVGGTMLSLMSVMALAVYWFNSYYGLPFVRSGSVEMFHFVNSAALLAAGTFSLCAGTRPARQIAGRVIRAYLSFLQRLFGRE